MRPLLLARHGQTAWNALGRLQGHTDIPLDEIGLGQARALAEAIADAGVTAIWTSDLVRARQTGEVVAAALGLPAPALDPDLRERRYGVFEGLTGDECAARHPEAWQIYLARREGPAGAEPRADAIARISRALDRIAATDGGPALIITHGGVMRLWLIEHLGPDVPPVGNAAAYVVEHDGSGYRPRLR
jgi:probable phosphoglycerate mutase